mgnify:CR=1 FL=1
MSQPNKTIATTLHCRVDNTPAILERLLRTVRVRGFTLENLTMKTNVQSLEVELRVRGQRNIVMLTTQLGIFAHVQDQFLTGHANAGRLSAWVR